MAKNGKLSAPRTKCSACPLRKREHFRDFAVDELDFVSSFKTGELTADAGATILVEGTHSAHLFTVLDGWAFRYKILDDGRRQILNFILPGDLAGLQGSLMGEMQHSVEALTPLTLCVFERGRLGSLFSGYPDLGFDLTWIAAREERILDEHLLSLGRRSALERAAYLLAFLNRRARSAGLFDNGRKKMLPVSQQHFADTLGLSIVHTNKTLRKIAARGLVRWLDRGCEVLDEDGLCKIAGWTDSTSGKRPFI
ncbi:cyclic nucleotide-binding domain-containing protein [Nitratireductor sp. CAU 1489]|uniref:Cyclic nucleotide-binding domain-containing protein n=1 Tax=Nitratireductor arenosus TaxID=2682096 RepID=A0A844QG07_9HYPH|nr:Crp/Fnr family transcriptional regulator [Nitratireductor arenosus]MVA96940.1 cyclic nucleotide-binding domain-containing protein [Nitratireductor arenosus]